MPGHSRSKNGVASLAYDPGIHDAGSAMETVPPYTLRFIMDRRVKPGDDSGV